MSFPILASYSVTGSWGYVRLTTIPTYNASLRYIYAPKITPGLQASLALYAYPEGTQYLSPYGTRFMAFGALIPEGAYFSAQIFGASFGPNYIHTQIPPSEFPIIVGNPYSPKKYSRTAFTLVARAIAEGVWAAAKHTGVAVVSGNIVSDPVGSVMGAAGALVNSFFGSLSPTSINLHHVEPSGEYVLALPGEKFHYSYLPSNQSTSSDIPDSLTQQIRELVQIMRELLERPDEQNIGEAQKLYEFLRTIADLLGDATAIADLADDLIGAVPATLAELLASSSTPFIKLLLELFKSLVTDGIIDRPGLPPRTVQQTESNADCCDVIEGLWRDTFLVNDLSPFYTDTEPRLSLADVCSVPSQPFPPFTQDSWPD